MQSLYVVKFDLYFCGQVSAQWERQMYEDELVDMLGKTSIDASSMTSNFVEQWEEKVFVYEDDSDKAIHIAFKEIVGGFTPGELERAQLSSLY